MNDRLWYILEISRYALIIAAFACISYASLNLYEIMNYLIKEQPKPNFELNTNEVSNIKFANK